MYYDESIPESDTATIMIRLFPLYNALADQLNRPCAHAVQCHVGRVYLWKKEKKN